MDKALMLSEFAGFNTRGISLDQAARVAIHAENTRDFEPTLGDLTVGMSSGTSGNPGVFLVSNSERQRWAGIALARALPLHLLKHLLTPWRRPVRIAFFLRANSNLYTTLHSRRIHFGFHDLLNPLESAFPSLNTVPPDLLVAPASVLKALAEAKLNGQISLQPSHIISVAEVLEPADAFVIEKAFHQWPHQIYQATEGFLGFTCESGTLHLNESYVHVEPDWLDNAQTRFQPVITDFTRETQMIVRYRLDDILTVAGSCSCGRHEMAISSIEGRSDEVLHLPSLETGANTPVFPDVLRRSLMLLGPDLQDYRIVQKGLVWEIEIQIASKQSEIIPKIEASITTLCLQLQLAPPQLRFRKWRAPEPGTKRQRLKCHSKPYDL